MATLSATQRTALEARKTLLETQLTALTDAMAAGATEVEGYTIDTGEGRQQMKYRTLKELMDAIDRTQTTITWIDDRLAGAGVVNMTLHRRP